METEFESSNEPVEPGEPSDIAKTLRRFEMDDVPHSSFNLILGKRRSGKSYLCEDLIQKMVKNKMLDMVFLFSGTDSGFDFICQECRFGGNMEMLNTIVENTKYINEYNSIAVKSQRIKLKIAIIIDDHAVQLKSQSFNILEMLATNGRHYAKAENDVALHVFVLCQSLTKTPKVVRLNCDLIIFNSIASMRERDLIFDENLYMLESSREGKKRAKQLYDDVMTTEDFMFMVVLNAKQNVKSYSDYLVLYKAD